MQSKVLNSYDTSDDGKNGSLPSTNSKMFKIPVVRGGGDKQVV